MYERVREMINGAEQVSFWPTAQLPSARTSAKIQKHFRFNHGLASSTFCTDIPTYIPSNAILVQLPHILARPRLSHETPYLGPCKPQPY